MPLPRFRAALAALLLLLSGARWSPGQTSTSRIEGVITDVSGAAVADARVAAVNVRTQSRTATTSNEQGFYIFASLAPGLYTVEAEKQGFSKQSVANLELNVGVAFTQNFRMEVGSVAESVTVEASAVQVNVTDAQIARTVQMKDIDVLPQLGRSPLSLVNFQAGVSADGGNQTFGYVNGLRQGANNLKLDGIDINDAVTPRLGLSLTPFNTDTVQEFRVVSNGGKAEYGRNAGAQVEVVSRTGTNQWHGNAFDYLRNTKLNANTFFNNTSGQARPKFIQNIYGGSLGAPILKNRWFVFGNFQGRRTSQDTVRNRTVYTAEARRGLFRYRSPGSTAIQTFDIAANDPRGRGLDPTVTRLLGATPLPNNTDVGDGLNTAGFRFNNPSGSQEDQWTLRSDYNLRDNIRLFYRYSWQTNSSIDALNNADASFPGSVQGRQGGNRTGYAIGGDWVLTPSLINETRLGHQNADVAFFRDDRPQGIGLDFDLVTDPLLLGFAQGRVSPVLDFTNATTKILRNHTVKVGYTFRRTTQNGYNDGGIYPNVAFGRTFGAIPPSTIGPNGAMVISSADRQRFESQYNELLGRVSSISQTYYSNLESFQPAGTPRVRATRFWDHAGFVQDDWRVFGNLTLNLGLRWDFFKSPVELNGFQGTFDQINQIGPTYSSGNLRVVRTDQWFRNDKNNFAPRFGFAYDPFRDGKTSIRGSYGIFYDRIIGAVSNLADGNTPGFAVGVQAFPNQAGGSSDVRLSDQPASAPQPATVPVQPSANRQTSVVAFSPDLTTPYAQHFSLTIQREIFRNAVIDVGFVGTRGVGLFNWLNLNQPRINGDFLNSFRELAAFSQSGTAVSAGNTLARLFGSPQLAVNALGATTLAQGLVGTATGTVDQSNFSRYAAAGVPDNYLRLYPQFDQFWFGDNVSRSSYNSLQVSFRRYAGDLRYSLNYTFSKSIDDLSEEGNGVTAVPDNFNLRLNRARSDFDRTHIMNFTATYTLPLGRGRRYGTDLPVWVDSVIGGWEIGALGLLQSGSVFTVTSGRRTGPSTLNAWANYSGDRNFGSAQKQGNGVIYFTEEQKAQFSFPSAGEIGTSGRNGFRGPGFRNVDLSLVKHFRLFESHRVTFRAESYNAFNNVNFANPGTSIVTPASFGRISGTVGSARIYQLALRYEF